jgi:hypothetical protein
MLLDECAEKKVYQCSGTERYHTVSMSSDSTCSYTVIRTIPVCDSSAPVPFLHALYR